MPTTDAYTFTRVLMGSPIFLKLFVDNPSLVDEVYARIAQLEDQLTVNRSHSEVMDINHAAGKHAVKVSPALFQLIRRATEVSLLPDSCFNLTIGPLVKRWKIGFQGHTVPPQAELDRLLSVTDPRQLVLDASDHSVFLPHAGMEIDLGAIAKGYIADVIKNLLYQRGVYHALINLGGNVQTLGRPQSGPNQQWAVGLQKPFGDNGELIGIIQVVNKSVVTSGIYERYFVAGDKLYHHILNPQTGYPLDNELLSVTIISDASIDGDIYTTLLYGMGVEKGRKYLEDNPHIEAIFVTRENKVIFTSAKQFTFTLLDNDYQLAE